MPLIGTHNVRNALAGIVVGEYLGAPAPTLVDALRRFKGVKRRLEIRGTEAGVTVYDDFAHHPTAIAETVGALRAAHPSRRIWAVFEPRSASSCRRVFQDEFGRAFRGADEVVIAAVFRSNLPEAERLSAEDLVRDINGHGSRARYLPNVDDIVEAIVRERREGDLVLIMSNGSFGGIHEKLLTMLREA
jgi:UDP-N-acetylmuramate: L-alanyl-gamma-D-glutamyl-meso-diaminopimelate ligase